MRAALGGILCGLVVGLLMAAPVQAASKVPLEATARTLMGPVSVEFGGFVQVTEPGDPARCVTAVADDGVVILLANDTYADGGFVGPGGAAACGASGLRLACEAGGKKGSCRARYRVDLLSRSFELEVSVSLPSGGYSPLPVANAAAGIACSYGTCSVQVKDGASLLVVATPYVVCTTPGPCGPGGTPYFLQSWTGCDELYPGNPHVCIVRMNSDREIEAEYSLSP